jgi:hypothetical protein
MNHHRLDVVSRVETCVEGEWGTCVTVASVVSGPPPSPLLHTSCLAHKCACAPPGGSGPSRHILSLYDDYNNLPANRAVRDATGKALAAGAAPAPSTVVGSPLITREQALESLDALYRLHFEDQVGKKGQPVFTSARPPSHLI